MLVILTLNQGCRNNFDDHDIISYYTDPHGNNKNTLSGGINFACYNYVR